MLEDLVSTTWTGYGVRGSAVWVHQLVSDNNGILLLYWWCIAVDL
jgi:hypothetical protein